jgi:hypothetical protein
VKKTLAPALSRIAVEAARPSVWAKRVLPFQWDERQIAFLDSQAMDSLILWSRQLGKSEVASARVAHNSIYFPGSLSLIVSATQRQAGILQRRVTADLRLATGDVPGWKRGREIDVEEVDADGTVRLVHCSVLSLELSNGAQVVSAPAHPDTVRGYSPDLLVIDEGARVPNEVVYALSPMRAAKRCPLICMTTAGAQWGWFYDAWRGDDQDYWRSEYKARECARISEAFLLKEKRRLPEHVFKAEYENTWFPIAGRLFSDEMIQSMRDPGSFALPDTKTVVEEGFKWA